MEGRIMRNMIALAVLVALISLYDVGNVVEAATGLHPPEKLKWHSYRKSCHEAEVDVRHEVELFYYGNSTLGLKGDKTIAAKLLKLVYTDCMTNGCDASILLDGPNSEKHVLANRGLAAFTLIDKIKTVIELRCPGVVSCADILQFATRDALKLAGAPGYPVFSGRRDGPAPAEKVDLPDPSISWEEARKFFESRGLDVQDMATLLGGAHSLGKTHCNYIMDRLYNFKNTGKPDPTMEKSTLNDLRKQCPKKRGKDGEHLVYLNPDSGDSYKFTNSLYKRVMQNKAVLGIDQQLLSSDSNTTQLVNLYAKDFEELRKEFALSMARMGEYKVLTGNNGEIRKNCRVSNNH